MFINRISSNYDNILQIYKNSFFYYCVNYIQMISFRNKGTNHSSGKIIKGCIKDATTKLSIGSIPSSYQSIIYRTQMAQGFGTSSSRFFKQNKKGLTNEAEQKLKDNVGMATTCFNKQGNSPFLSKVKRQFFKPVWSPGVGRYRIPISFDQKQQQIIKTQKFKIPRFINKKGKIICQRTISPGPAHYQTSDFTSQAKNKGWKSSFITKVARNSYIPISISPGPTHYLIQTNKQISPTQAYQQNKQNNKQQIVKNNFHPSSNKNTIIGPNSYNQTIPDFKPLYQKVKISSNFMSGIKDRFNDYQQKRLQTVIQPETSPFSYQIKSSFDELKNIKLIESSFFMSEAKRQIFQSAKKKLGPNYDNNYVVEDKNFHFNIRDNWV